MGNGGGSNLTFMFSALPEGRTVKTIRVRMTERTGATKALPFRMEDLPLR